MARKHKGYSGKIRRGAAQTFDEYKARGRAIPANQVANVVKNVRKERINAAQNTTPPATPAQAAAPKTKPENVTQTPENVTQAPENVAQAPENVAQAPEDAKTAAVAEEVTETSATTDKQDLAASAKKQENDLNFGSVEDRINALQVAAAQLPPGERGAIEDEIKRLEEQKAKNTADLATDEKTDKDNPKGVPEGEKFSEGDIIKYLYGEFLKALSKGFDYVDAFLLTCGKKGGEFLGNSIKNIMQGYKDLAEKYKKDAPVREYQQAAATVWKTYAKQEESYKKVRDAQVENLKNAAVLGTILSKCDLDFSGNISLASVEKQYAQLKGKKHPSTSDKRKMRVLEGIIPPEGETYPEIKYSYARRHDMFRANLKKMAEEFGPELAGLAMPKEKESLNSFRSRFNLSAINATIDNIENLCDIRCAAARVAATKTLAEYASEVGKDVTADEKTQFLLSHQLENTKKIHTEVDRNFGDIVRNGISDDDMARIGTYFNEVGNAAANSISLSARHLDEKKSLNERQDDIKQELTAINDVTMPEAGKIKPEKPRVMPDTKKIGLEGFAQKFNEKSQVESDLDYVTKRIAQNEAEKAANEAEKAKLEKIKRDNSKHATGRPGAAERAANRTVNNLNQRG